MSVMPVFRVYRFAADHPGLAGKDLTPGETIEEMETETTLSRGNGPSADPRPDLGRP